MVASTTVLSCILLAAQTYTIPPAVLVGIYAVEQGRVGQEVSNTNGSHDLGPMQINTLWMPVIAKEWGVKEDTARAWVRDDTCTNVGVAAWIFKSHLDETGDYSKALSYYHSRTPSLGRRYQTLVLTAMRDYGLLSFQ